MSLSDPTRKRNIFKLIGDLPRLFTDLVRSEIEQLKNELVGKAKQAGIGIGLIAAAVFFLLIAFIVLIFAAVLGLAEVVPVWAAALIVAGGLILITAILALIGVSSVKKGLNLAPEETIESVQKDVEAIKGI